MKTLRWSPCSKKDLVAIRKWYCLQASKKVADKIVLGIIQSAMLLITHPRLGHPELMLEDFPQGFRCLSNVPNYKIIYWIEDDFIKIATVFDTRQRPEKVYEIISTGTDWVCEPQVHYGKK